MDYKKIMGGYVMKKIKLIFSIFCIVVLALAVLAGCGNNETELDSQQSGDKQNEGSKKIELRLAGQHPVEHMATEALNRIKETIAEKSNGRIEITIYPANQLGDYTQVYEEIMRGTIDMALISIPSQYDPRLEIGFIPYIAANYEEIKKVFASNSFLFNEVTKLHDNLGVKFLGFFGEGFGGIGCSKMPEAPANFNVDKGLLVRVPPMDVFKFGAEDLGYRTTTIPYAETYAALQTGVADGWVGGPPNLNYLWFRDVIDYYLQYNNSFESTSFVMNKKLFESLSPEDQKIIQEAIAAESENSFDLAKADDEKYRKMLREEGIEVIEFTDEELKAMAEHAREVTWPKLTKRLTEELVQGLKESY
ncbi:MAG: TRAP-type transport system periplasmic protein [Clostridia bacterium]|nr:TRAP-type transport system periplasmic protein [Clostridia bacterium]